MDIQNFVRIYAFLPDSGPSLERAYYIAHGLLSRWRQLVASCAPVDEKVFENVTRKLRS